jgi:hypothetical protein
MHPASHFPTVEGARTRPASGPARRVSGMTGVLLAVLLGGCDPDSRDQSLIRAEFDLPPAAEVIEYASSPPPGGWFGREGLKITLILQLSPTDYAGYAQRARASGQWRPLPIPESFLRRMAAIDSAKRQRQASTDLTGQPLPKAGTVYNPDEQQMLARFTDSLPAPPARGLFQVRTAGDDVLRTPKRIVTTPDTDLSDFMLIMLDDDRQRVLIKVSTFY